MNDPSGRVAAAYRAVHEERMRDLPFLNPAVAVEAVGFRPWQGAWLGALVTPWSINILLVPGEPSAWVPLAPGAERFVDFPAGTYRFAAGEVPGLGEVHGCSLFSPVQQFADHEAARIAATAALEALLDPATGAEARPPLSKREFLQGRFAGTADVARR